MLNITVKDRFRHSCDLPQETPVLDGYILRDTRLHKLKKFITKLRTVSNSEDTRRYFRSHAERMKERKRHLLNREYSYMVHPFSSITRGQSKFLSVLWLLVMIADSYSGTFLAREFYRRKLPILQGCLYVVNLILFFDVFLRLMTGYTIEKTRTVIIDPKLSMKHYLKTYFVADLLASFGYLVFYHSSNLRYEFQMFFFQLHVLRFVRLKTVLQYMDKSMMHLKIDETVRKLGLIALIGLLAIHFLTCLSGFYVVMHKVLKIPYDKNSWYQLAKHERMQSSMIHTEGKVPRLAYVFYLYLLHCGMVSCHFFGLHSFRYITTDEIEMIYRTFVILLGMWYYIYCIAKILQLIEIVNMSDAKYDELLLNVDDYMRKKKFPLQLKTRIGAYYDYKFNKKYFNEKTILGSLSEHLQMEVLLYNCKNLINRVYVFRGLSKSAVGCLLSLMKQEIFVPRDEILPAGDDTNSIYFILYGTCGIRLESGKEVMHIEDGDHFGQVTGVEYELGTKLLYSVVALEMVKIYRLDKKDIAYSVRNYPEIQARLESMEKNRVKHFSDVFTARGDEEDVTEDIINELRKGRILWHGIKRSDFLL